MKIVIEHIGSNLEQDRLEAAHSFIRYLNMHYKLPEDVKIIFYGKKHPNMTTGSRNKNSELRILTRGRLLIDILRTLAHEWLHEYQVQVLGMKPDADPLSLGEKLSNIDAGAIMKYFNKDYPEYEQILYT